MEQSNKNSLKLISGVFACFLLFFSLTIAAGETDPGTNASKPAGSGQGVGEDKDQENKGCDVNSMKAAFNGIDESEVKSIQQLLNAGGYLIDWADGKPGPETNHALARLCQYMENTGLLMDEGQKDQAVAESFKSLLIDEPDTVADTLQQQNSFISLAATNSIADPLKAGCGCSRDFDAQVYGFLPYWLADGTPRGADFSMLDRIGFYGLQIDQLDADGKIRYQSLWRKGGDSEPQIARLINAAVRHRVKVDVTFYSAQWMDWSEAKIDKVAAAVAQAASQKFSDTSDDDDITANLLGLLRKLLPFVEDNSTVYVDGINLYFDNYENAGDAGKLMAVVSAVGRRMPGTTLNIMLAPNWSGIGATSDADRSIELGGIKQQLFSALRGVLKDDAEVDLGNLLVFLPRNTQQRPNNTSNAKKLLRRAIEDAFDGDGNTRRSVLRKTLPIVVTFNDEDQPKDYFGTDNSQFEEDLIYLQDNFAGVGLWPLPLLAPVASAEDESGDSDDSNGDATSSAEPGKQQVAQPNDGELIDKTLLSQYEIKADWRKSLRWQEVDNLIDALCEFACPNRWLFRLVFDFLAGMLVLYCVLAFFNCRLRRIYQQKFFYFFGYVVATAAVFAVSLVCDPYWNRISTYVMVVIVLLLVGYIGFKYIRRALQPKYP